MAVIDLRTLTGEREPTPTRARVSGWLARIRALPVAQRSDLARQLRLAAEYAPPVRKRAPRLVAYVVPRKDAVVSAGELRSFLAERLPSTLIPTSFVTLDSLPRLPSGKLDRRALPVPDPGRNRPERRYVAPRTPVEELICRVLAEVLAVPDVGVDDEFWELGGDSLLAGRVMSRVRHELGVGGEELGIRSLFEHPTAARLAVQVGRARYGAGSEPDAQVVAVPRDEPPPLSTAQLRHWFLQAMDPAGTAYNISDTLRITGHLDTAALQRAFAAVVDRHEILRTGYRVVDGRPEPVIEAGVPVPVPVADLIGMSADARDRIAAELLAFDRDRTFDLAHPPLLRPRLIRLSDTEHLVSIVVHHIVADDWAFNVLYLELTELYAAFTADRAHRLPPLKVQYADYAWWERRMLASRLAPGLAYWRAALLTAPATPTLPGEDTAAAATPAGVFRFEVSAELTARVEAWCQTRSVTPFAVCLAAFAGAVADRAGRDEVVVGVPFVNRERPEWERMIGCFINPAALRIDRRGVTGPADLVDRTASTIKRAYALQEVPFEKVTEAVRLARAEAGQPDAGAQLFDVVVNFVPAPARLELAGATVRREDDAGAIAPAKYALTLYLERAERVLGGRLVYAPDRVSGPTVATLATSFLAYLGDVAAARPGSSAASEAGAESDGGGS